MQALIICVCKGSKIIEPDKHTIGDKDHVHANESQGPSKGR